MTGERPDSGEIVKSLIEIVSNLGLIMSDFYYHRKHLIEHGELAPPDIKNYCDDRFFTYRGLQDNIDYLAKHFDHVPDKETDLLLTLSAQVFLKGDESSHFWRFSTDEKLNVLDTAIIVGLYVHSRLRDFKEWKEFEVACPSLADFSEEGINKAFTGRQVISQSSHETILTNAFKHIRELILSSTALLSSMLSGTGNYVEIAYNAIDELQALVPWVNVGTKYVDQNSLTIPMLNLDNSFGYIVTSGLRSEHLTNISKQLGLLVQGFQAMPGYADYEQNEPDIRTFKSLIV